MLMGLLTLRKVNLRVIDPLDARIVGDGRGVIVEGVLREVDGEGVVLVHRVVFHVLPRRAVSRQLWKCVAVEQNERKLSEPQYLRLVFP